MRMSGQGETERQLERAPGKRPAVLTEVQEHLLLLPLREQLVVRQEVCVLLLLDLLDDGFRLLERRQGRRETPVSPNRTRGTRPCPLPPPQVPDAHQTGPCLGLLGWCFLVPPFYKENPATVKPQPDNLSSWLFQICRGTSYFFILSFNTILLTPH